MGVAHHAAYVVWLEAARVEWMRDRGLSYREMEDSGVSMAVSGLELHYRRAARFDDVLRVDCRLVSLRSRYGRYAYQLLNERNELVASGATDHVPTDRRGRAVRLPSAWLDALQPHLEPEEGDA